jgi:septum formation protein
MDSRPLLILASESPRRRELLAQLALVPDHILPAHIDETPLKNELPRSLASRLSAAKAEAVAQSYALEQPAFILAADTVVHLGRRILPKAEDNQTVAKCLARLSGRRHKVLTALSVIRLTPGEAPLARHRVSETIVQFKRLHPDEIAAYVASHEGLGKAGGYAIQGKAAGLIAFISGSYSGVVGLPLYETRILLEGLGWQDA